MKKQLRVVAMLAGLAAALSFPVFAAQAEPDEKVKAPDIVGGTKWINSAPLTMADLKGKVVLIDFWEYTCVNCIRTFPYLKAWHERYKDKGLVIVGVHTPEFHFAFDEKNVTDAVKKFGFKYPVVVDSDFKIWDAYSNRFWPAKYVVDPQGYLRALHFGEGAYVEMEAYIQKLLKERDPKVELPPLMKPIRGSDGTGAVCYPVTPELYFGYKRGIPAASLANPEGYIPGKVLSYKDKGRYEDGALSMNGQWKNMPDAMVSVRQSPHPRDYVAIKYHALEVNTVMRPESGKAVRVWVYHDDKPILKKDKGEDIRYDSLGRSYIVVDEPRMYNVVKNAEFGHHRLKLATAEPGLGLYSFTFVSCEKKR